MIDIKQAAITTVATLYGVTEKEVLERYPEEVESWERVFANAGRPTYPQVKDCPECFGMGHLGDPVERICGLCKGSGNDVSGEPGHASDHRLDRGG